MKVAIQTALKLLASVNPSETRRDNESSSHRFLMPLSLSSFSQSSPIVLRTRIPFILRRHESRRDSSNLSAQNLSCILPPFSILSLVSNERDFRRKLVSLFLKLYTNV